MCCITKTVVLDQDVSSAKALTISPMVRGDLLHNSFMIFHSPSDKIPLSTGITSFFVNSC